MIFSRTLPKSWNIKNYLSDHKQRIETRIAQLPLQEGKTTRALEAMRYALQVPGKRFRPLLVLATADIYRQSMDPLILDCAVAVECVHTSSLLFDDLPCMDDAMLRRGKKPTHLVFDEAQAILAGMSLIAEANKLLAAHHKGRKGTVARCMEALSLLNHAYSVHGLSGGQSDDLLNKTNLELGDLEYIHAKKTGALFVACTEMAAVMCDAPDSERQWLKSYAKNLGLAFQIQDDLLDLQSEKTTGKSAGRDSEKTTFVDLCGEEKCIKLAKDLLDVSMQNLTPFGESATHLRELTRVIQKRTF